MSDPRHSVLTLYHDIPFDPDYNHTVLFPDVACQNMWFQTKVLATNIPYTTMSYLRHTRGVIRIQSKMNLLTNCNYISFYNPETVDTNTVLGYEDVKFYAFVDNIDYINENTVELTYTIDQIQTWMFYYLLNPCYVEREHVRSDGIGENRVKEGLDTGDYTVSGFESLDFWGWDQPDTLDLTNTGYVVIATQPYEGGTGNPRPRIMNGIWGVLAVYECFDKDEFLELLWNYANGATGNFDPIIAVYQIPGVYIGSYTNPGDGNILKYFKMYETFNLSLDVSLGVGGFRNWNASTGSEDLYVPLNNKLYTYPYNFLVLESPDGSTQQLKYENFQHIPSYVDHIGFIIYLATFPEPETMCIPLNYESTQFMANIRNALCSKQYPTVPLASSAFQAWWAQNRYSMPVIDAVVEGNVTAKNFVNSVNTTGKTEAKILEYVTTGLSAIGNMATSPSSAMQIGGRLTKIGADGFSLKHPVAGAFSEAGTALEEIGKQLASYEGHKAIPNTVATKANNGGITHATHTDCYKVYYTQIRPEYARIIDRYLSVFGYAIQYVKQPDIESRVVWNYIKTVGCTIRPNAAYNRSVPMEAERIITKIYDKGITFWHWPELIHQYVHSFGTDDEPKMYNPIGTPYNFPGMPGYLPNPEPWAPTPPEPTPTPTPPVTGTKIYMQCDAGWTQPYIVGFPVQGEDYYIVPMTSEGDNVWSCDASLFNENLQAVPPRPYSYYIMVFVNGNTASTWNSYSNYYNIESTETIIPLYDLPTNDPIGSFYVGLTNPFTGSPVVPSVPTIYFQYYTSANNMYVLNMSTMDTLPMTLVTASDSQERVWSIPLSEIESWAAFAFSTTSTYDASHPENASQVLYKTTTPSPQQVYSGTSEYMGNYYIGTSNPFRSNSEDKIYMQFVTEQTHMYVMTTDGGQVITKPMTRVQGINVQDRVWVIDLSEVSSWTQMIFTTETSFQPTYASEAIDKTRTESPRQFMNWNQNVYLGNYYVGPNNPFIS